MALAVEFIVLEGKSVISNQTYFKAFKQRFLKELDSDNDDTERQREIGSGHHQRAGQRYLTVCIGSQRIIVFFNSGGNQ